MRLFKGNIILISAIAGFIMATMAILMWFAPNSTYTPPSTPAPVTNQKQSQPAPVSLSNTKQPASAVAAPSVSNKINSEDASIIQSIKQYNDSRYVTPEERRSYLINALSRYSGKPEVEAYIIDLIAMTPSRKNVDALLPYLKSSNTDLVKHTVAALSNQAVDIDDNLQQEGLTKEQVADLQSTRMRIADGINEIYHSPLTQAWVKEEILANYATTNPSASDLSTMTTQLVKAGKLTDAGIDFIAVALVETPTAPVAEILSTLKTIDAKQKTSVADAVVSHMNLSEAQLAGENQQLISDFIKTSASKN
jgi:hypothetical protein